LAAGSGSPRLVAGAFAVVAILAATHDIAIDGFYLQALDKQAQAAFSGLRVAAYRGAMLLGGVLVALAGSTSWRACFAASGTILALLAGLHALRLPRPVVPSTGAPRT